MDILKIRKKGRGAAPGDKPAGPEASAAPPPPTDPAPPASDAPAPAPDAPAPAPPGPPPAAAPDSAAGAAWTSRAAVRVKDEAVAIEPREVDPLGEFLARYDEAEAGTLGEANDVSDAPRYLAFDLERERYATSILSVREILKTAQVTPVPRCQRGVLGVLSKRGVVMPVVDLAACLELRDIEQRVDTRQRILVVGEGDHICGLRVDAVHGVVELPAGDIGPVPAGVEPRGVGVLHGLGRVGGVLHILLDADAFLAFLENLAE